MDSLCNGPRRFGIVMGSSPNSTVIDSAGKLEREDDRGKHSEDIAMMSTYLDDNRTEAMPKCQHGTGQIEHERPITKIHLTSAPVIDSSRLGWPSNGTRSCVEEMHEQVEERIKKISDAMRTILECIGEDTDREGLLATPQRYAESMLFLTKGYKVDLDTIINDALFHERHDGMVIVRDIAIHSLCEHHVLPFYGKIHIGYIPSDTVIGLSKLTRIVEMFSRRLQIQERLTGEVAHAVMDILHPRGVAVIMIASHLCMAIRGVEKTDAVTVTSCSLGCFEDEPSKREEFISLVGMKKKT